DDRTQERGQVTMSDDLDELDAALRRAMAALDGDAPAGYFEALPGRTLARLDDPVLGAALGAAIDELPEEPARPLRAVRPPAEDEAEDEADDEADGAVFASQVMAAVELPEPDGTLGAVPRDDRAPAAPVAPVESMETAPDARRFGSASAASSMQSVGLR